MFHWSRFPELVGSSKSKPLRSSDQIFLQVWWPSCCPHKHLELGNTDYHNYVLNSSLVKTVQKLEAKDVLPNINRMQADEGPKNAVFVPGDLDLWPLTLTFKLVQARDRTRLPLNLEQVHSAVPEIFHTQTKKVTDSAKTEPSTVHCVW